MPIMSLTKARITDPVLSNIIQGFRQPSFIGQRFMPPVPVAARAGYVVQFGLEDFALYDTRRAPGSRIKRTQSQYASRTFTLYQDSIAEEVPLELFEEALNGAARINLRLNAPRKAMRKVMLRLEKDIADLIQNPALYESSNTIAVSGAGRWDVDTSNPKVAVQAWRQAVRAQTGTYPTRLGMGSAVFDATVEHPKVRDRFKYTSSESVTKDMLAKYFEVESIEVGEAAALNSAGVLTDIWGKNVWMAQVPGSQTGALPVPQADSAREEPAFGYTYVLQNYPIALPERFDEDCASFVYAVMAERSPELVGMGATGKVGAGFLATTVIS